MKDTRHLEQRHLTWYVRVDGGSNRRLSISGTRDSIPIYAYTYSIWGVNRIKAFPRTVRRVLKTTTTLVPLTPFLLDKKVTQS